MQEHRGSRHVVVIYKGQYFMVEALTARNAPRPVPEIHADILALQKQADAGVAETRVIAALTALPRTEWADGLFAFYPCPL